MPPVRSPARRFFKQVTGNKLMCLSESCQGKLFSNVQGANLERHLKRFHPELHIEVVVGKKQAFEHRTLENLFPSSAENLCPSSGERSSSGPLAKNAKNTLTVCIDREAVLEGCIELVTVNGHPFKVLDDSGMRKLLDPILEALACVTINAETIPGHISMKALDIRAHIRKELQGKLISLKVDSAMHLDHCFMGINVQFIHEGKLVLRTLALRHIDVTHSSENLKQIILDVLNDFGIHIGNLYSITSDNASNMIKLLRKLQGELKVDEDTFEDGQELEDSDDLDINSVPPEDVEDLEENPEIVDVSGFPDDVLRSMRCAVYTLQLAVHDALKSLKGGSSKDLLNKVRAAVKKLRTPTMATFLKCKNIIKPLLDCPTRWSSTHDMIEGLRRAESVCRGYIGTGSLWQKNEPLNFEASEWQELENLQKALEHAKLATLQMQREQLTPGECYAIWLRCEVLTRKEGLPLAISLADAMKVREKKLFECDGFLAAVLLDSRFNVMLLEQPDLVTRGMEHIARIWQKLQRLQENGSEGSAIVPQNKESDTSAMEEAPDDDLETLLSRAEAACPRHPCSRSVNITEKMAEFLKRLRLGKNTNILAKWEEDRFSSPELYEIARVALALPCTQVSVERLFSSLKFVLSPQRSQLSPNLIDDILVVRSWFLFNKQNYE